MSGRRWALVAYEPGVKREEWCRDGHWGYVLEGELGCSSTTAVPHSE